MKLQSAGNLTGAIFLILNTLLSPVSGMSDARVKKSLRASEFTVVSKRIGCLVAQNWVQDDLRELGLRNGEIATVRYRTGTVPGTSPSAPDVTNVLIYSQEGNQGWLLFYRTEKNGGTSVIRNGYWIERSGDVWTAGEGNGGITTYKAMGAYAAKLAKQNAIKVTLIPDHTNCSAED